MMQYEEIPFQREGFTYVYYMDRYHGPPERIWSLIIGCMDLEPIPASLREMVNLQQLEVRRLQLDDVGALFEQLDGLPRLMNLDFFLIKGQPFPPSLWRMKALRKMTLSSMGIPAFPELIRGLSNLREMNLDIHEWLGEEPHLAELGALPELQSMTIVLRDNHPRGFAHLQQVKRLTVKRLDRSLDGLGKMTSLENLQLEYLHENANVVADLQETAFLTPLRRLKVKTWGQMVFPESWAGLQGLEALDLSECRLAVLPNVMVTLPRLKHLNLSNNQLTSIPEWIGEMTSLEEVNLGKNQLKSLPSSFSRLHHLQKIVLDDNAFEAFPNVLLEIASLQSLSIAKNKIVRFPQSPLQCSSLRHIDLRENNLAMFPLVLLDLPKAEMLVGGNPFVKEAGYKIEDVLQSVSQRYRKQDDRSTLLALAMGDLDLALEKGTFEQLLTALHDENEKLRGFAVAALSQSLPDPFAGGPAFTKIALLGQSKGYPVQEYQRHLKERGITLIVGRPAEADVIVMGERPGHKVAHYRNSGKPLGTLPQLAAFVETLANRWLRDQSAALPKIAENFQRLWESMSPENLKLALEMMTAGGLPGTVSLTEVLALSLFFPDPEVKRLAANFVNARASPTLRAFIRANTRDLYSISAEGLEEYVLHYLKFLGDDGPGFAKMAYRLNKKLKTCLLRAGYKI